MKIYRAPDTPESYATVVRLRRQAQQWLAASGSDQWVNDWPDTATMLDGFVRALRNGETWFAATDDGQIQAAVTLNHETAADLWSPEEIDTALFIHRLTIDRSVAGQGIGRALIDFAEERAAAEGKLWLRLDAWTTNRNLHAYYISQGFRLARINEGHHTPSAACFERRVNRARLKTH